MIYSYNKSLDDPNITSYKIVIDNLIEKITPVDPVAPVTPVVPVARILALAPFNLQDEPDEEVIRIPHGDSPSSVVSQAVVESPAVEDEGLLGDEDT